MSERADKALVVRSCGSAMPQAKRFCRKRSYQTVDLLHTNDPDQQLESDPEFLDTTYALKSDGFSPDHLSGDLKHKLRSLPIADAIVLKPELNHPGYGNVMNLATQLNPDQVILLDIQGHSRSITPWRFWLYNRLDWFGAWLHNRLISP